MRKRPKAEDNAQVGAIEKGSHVLSRNRVTIADCLSLPSCQFTPRRVYLFVLP